MQLLFTSFVHADYICEATCIDANSVSYTHSGNKGPSYKILNRAIPIDSKGETKRQAWRRLVAKCGPYLLVSSYETEYEFAVGTVITQSEEAKRRNVCRSRRADIPKEDPKLPPPLRQEVEEGTVAT